MMKKTLEKIEENGEIACFLFNLYLKILLIATFQLSSAASLNLGWSQNGVLENRLTKIKA